MNTSLQWLTDFLLGAKFDAHGAGDALTRGGLPVEHFEQRGDGDVMLDVEVTSNRSDCLSHIGVARELAALLNLRFQDAEPIAAEATEPARARRRCGSMRRTFVRTIRRGSFAT
jgi:phenylalanyl-tRNA synthetase beta chain